MILSKVKSLAYLIALLISFTLLQACSAIHPSLLAIPVTTNNFSAFIYDPRSHGTKIDDKLLQWKIVKNFKQELPKHSDILVDVYNRRVLLAGNVQNKEIKNLAEEIVQRFSNIRKIITDIKIGLPRTLQETITDSTIDKKLHNHFCKFRLKKKLCHKIHSITYRNVIYLTGILNKKEGQVVTEKATKMPRTKKIIQLFEYSN